MYIYKLFHDLWQPICGWPHGICKQTTTLDLLGLSFRYQLRVENKLRRRVKLSTFYGPKLPNSGRHAIEIVNIHLIVVEFRTV